MDISSNFGVTMDWLCFGNTEVATNDKSEAGDQNYQELAEARKAIQTIKRRNRSVEKDFEAIDTEIRCFLNRFLYFHK